MDMFKEMEQNPELNSMMETLMQKFMTKEVLQESLKELEEPLKCMENGPGKVFTVGGAYYAGELDANRAIDQATRLALKIENANSGAIFERPKSFASKILAGVMKK